MTKKKVNNIGDMILIDTVYRPSIGSFGKPNGIKNERYVVKNWYHCREIWHNQMYNAKLFFYAHPVSRNKSLSAFFEKIETILNVQEKSIFPISVSCFFTIRLNHFNDRDCDSGTPGLLKSSAS